MESLAESPLGRNACSKLHVFDEAAGAHHFDVLWLANLLMQTFSYIHAYTISNQKVQPAGPDMILSYIRYPEV